MAATFDTGREPAFRPVGNDPQMLRRVARTAGEREPEVGGEAADDAREGGQGGHDIRKIDAWRGIGGNLDVCGLAAIGRLQDIGDEAGLPGLVPGGGDGEAAEAKPWPGPIDGRGGSVRVEYDSHGRKRYFAGEQFFISRFKHQAHQRFSVEHAPAGQAGITTAVCMMNASGRARKSRTARSFVLGLRTGTESGDRFRFQVSACREEATALRPERGLGAIGDTDPLEDVGEVGFHRLFADSQRATDLRVGHAASQEEENLGLTRG